MKMVVAGGRRYTLSDADILVLHSIVRGLDVREIVEGGCTGVDAGAKQYAILHGMAHTSFPVTREEWDRLGRKAGPLRNARMAEYADAALLFPGGAGTASMRSEMLKRGKMVISVMVESSR